MKKLGLVLMAVFIVLYLSLFDREDKAPYEKKESRAPKAPKAQNPKESLPQNKKSKSKDSTPGPENSGVAERAKPKPLAHDEHKATQSGDLQVSQILVLGEHALAHGDILIGSYDEVLEMERIGKLPKIKRPMKWKRGIVPYSIHRNYPTPKKIKRVLQYMAEKTPIQFIQQTKRHKDYILFKLGEEHCFSSLGRQGGEQKVILSPSCKEKEIAHEVMHALGFFHEQNRKDRDQHIRVHWDNIKDDYTEQFKKIPEAMWPIEQASFDFKSTMLYPPYAFALSPTLPTLTTREGEIYQNGKSWLSQGDLEKVKALYSAD